MQLSSLKFDRDDQVQKVEEKRRGEEIQERQGDREDKEICSWS